MMKSEYDRRYQWNHNENDHNVYFKKHNREDQLSEPRMTHKRRVKMTEDNVVIGAPLLHQSVGEAKEFVSSKKDDKKRSKKHEKDEIIRNEKKERRKMLVNESVQTDIGNNEKSTQLSKRVVESKYEIGGNIENQRIKKTSFENNAPSREDNFINNKAEKQRSSAQAQTEYQKKYAWKDNVSKNNPQNTRASEMMSSLDTKLKIYNNFISEYQRQFRPYEFVTENRYKKMKPIDDMNLKFVPDRTDAHRRAVTPPPHVTVKNKSYKAADTANPQKMGFPQGKHKRFLTEYSANFDNKWERLDAEMARNVEEKAREANSQAKWFQEILELRKKAQEYRQRSRGTHFSREHLGQVYSRRRACKDDEGNRDRANGASDRIVRVNSCHGLSNLAKKASSSSDNRSCSSYSSKSASSTVIVVSAPRSRSPSPLHLRTAGKPTNDNSMLLDEEASHDTAIKSPPGQPQSRPITASSNLNQSQNRQNTASPNRSLRHSNNRAITESSNCNLRESHQGFRPSDVQYPIKDERQYTLEKYFNIDRPDEDRQRRTLDYDSVSKCSSNGRLSTRSIISSSTMSLAIDTLERAKRNRDVALRQKS